MIDAAPAATTPEAAVETGDANPAAAPAPAGAATSAARKPNKFMADLTKAMQTAAEATRADAIERLSAEAKAHIERIHSDAATEATELRKQCDDDVAGVREWSKQEIARIREETDERITHRKERLEREIEQHGGEVEARIERVNGRVAAFEAEMAAFFERLLAEEDPTRFAAMAESLPEPPPFDTPTPYAAAAPAAAAVTEPVETVATATAAEAVAEADWTPAEAPEATVATTEAPAGDWVSDAANDWATQPVEAAAETVETPETFEAVEAVAEAVEPAEVAEAVAETTSEGAMTEVAVETVADATVEGETTETTEADVDPNPWPAAEFAADQNGADPRLSALGISPDFAAAEAEAAQFTPDDAGTDEGIVELADETISARLAGLGLEADAAAGPASTTKLVVTGLVSVASIAGFKRHLSRANGVTNVGVSSGPDGEFIFSVTHDSGVALRDIVPTLPGFAARVTGEGDGEVQVTAQDPETER